MLYQAKKCWQNSLPCPMVSNHLGKSGRYFIVLNCDSENRLSFGTRGRVLDLLGLPTSAYTQQK